MFYGERSPLSGSNSFHLASKLPSSLFSPSFDRSSTLTSRLFTSIPPLIKSSAGLLPFLGSRLLLLDDGTSDKYGGELLYLIRYVDSFLLHLVVFAGSTFPACQQVVGHRTEVIAKVASHNKTKEYLKTHTQKALCERWALNRHGKIDTHWLKLQSQLQPIALTDWSALQLIIII